MANFELAQKAFSDVVTLVRPTANDYTDRHGDTQTAAIDSPRFNHDAATLDASTQTINLSTLTVEDISADISGTPLTVALSGSVVYPIGSTFVLSDSADIGRYISGSVTASSAGSVTFIVQKKVGSGVGSDWIGIRALGLMLDDALAETGAFAAHPPVNPTAGYWVVTAFLDQTEPLEGAGLAEIFDGSGRMVISYSGGTAKVWAGGEVIYTVSDYAPATPNIVCEGGTATVESVVYYPEPISDADAAALATGDFEIYVPLSPSQLFSEGQQGAWYDPSDLSTLFQDSAGTTPVTADGDPAGMALDKHLGLELGPELVVNGTFDTDVSGWSNIELGNYESGLQFIDGKLQITATDGSTGGAYQIINTVPGKWYRVSFLCDKNARIDISKNPAFPNGNIVVSTTSEAGVTGHLTFQAPDADVYVTPFTSSDGVALWDNVSVRELPGNHATQSTTAAKPTYRTDGTLHWLEFDGDDDQLVATIPGITNATVAIAKSTGTEITYPVDLSGGEFVMDETNYGVIVREGEFTEQEALNVTAYLNAKAGIES